MQQGQPIHSDIYDHYEDESFYTSFATSFTYPFRKRGWMILAAGVIFFWLAQLLSFIPLVSLVVSIFTTGYMISYFTRVITTSSDGDERLPEWPDFTTFYDDIMRPIFRWTVLFVLALVPAIGFFATGFSLAGLIMAVAGVVYLPMALTAASLHEDWRAANPLLVIPAILAAPLQYILAITVIGVASGASYFLQTAVMEGIPFFGGVALTAIGLYFAIVQCRILGLFYYCNDEAINWFGEADRYYR